MKNKVFTLTGIDQALLLTAVLTVALLAADRVGPKAGEAIKEFLQPIFSLLLHVPLKHRVYAEPVSTLNLYQPSLPSVVNPNAPSPQV